MSHHCEGKLPEDGYGEAITYCDEVEQSDLNRWAEIEAANPHATRNGRYADKHTPGQLWVSNGEYGSQVNFCPYCGYGALVKL